MNDEDLLKAGRNAAKELSQAVDSLIKAGDAVQLQRLVKDVAKTLGIEEDALEPFLERGRSAAAEQRAAIGKDLKSAAEAAGCEFSYKPPYAQIGCVKLTERKPGQWSLSVLDDVKVETLNSSSGDALAKAAVRRIEGIQRIIDRFDANRKHLLTAIEVARRWLGSSRDIPVNLLMLAAAQGNSLKSALSSPADAKSRPQFSRAEFGFLLFSYVRRSRDQNLAPTVTLGGAPQSETGDPDRYVAVPDSDDPRKQAVRRLVSTVTVLE